MELLELIPEAEAALEQGRMTLTNASQLQGFFRAEEKAGKKLPLQEKQKLFEKIQGLSKTKVERVLASLSPQSALPDRERVISETQTEVRFVADEELMSMLEKIKNLTAHRNPDPSYLELFKIMSQMVLNKIDPMLKAEKSKTVKNIKIKSFRPNDLEVNHSSSTVTKIQAQHSRSVKISNQYLITEIAHADFAKSTDRFHLNKTKQIVPEKLNHIRQNQTTALEKSQHLDELEHLEYKTALQRIHDFKQRLAQTQKNSRYIKARIRREVWKRDQGQCTFNDPLTSHKCNSRYGLEIDHILPFALGGESESENLRILCRAHNTFAAAKIFGIKKIRNRASRS